MKKVIFIWSIVLSLFVSGCTSTSSRKRRTTSSNNQETTSSNESSKITSNNSSSGESTSQDVTRVTSDTSITTITSGTTGGSSGGSSSGTTGSTSGGTSGGSTTGSTGSVTSHTTSSATSSATSSTTSGTSVTPPPSEEMIEGVFFEEASIEVKVGSKSKTPLVEVFYAEGHSIDDFDNPLTWDTSDHNIAEADEYGRVTGKAKGRCILTCTTVVDNHSASVEVLVYNNESDFKKEWKRMEPTVTLKPGDELIIACPSKSKAANEDDKEHKLHSADIVLNDDESVITDVGSAAQFVLGTDIKGRDGYNLEIPEREDGKYLACTNEKNISFFDTPKSSQNLWEIYYNNEQNCWDMRSALTIDGWMMYNVDKDWFAPYQSNETDHMIVITLYRLTKTFND